MMGAAADMARRPAMQPEAGYRLALADALRTVLTPCGNRRSFAVFSQIVR